jgi:hypothetical protein
VKKIKFRLFKIAMPIAALAALAVELGAPQKFH